MPVNKNIRLAIVCTHPIQYYVPVFQMLAQKITLKVFYTRDSVVHYDEGFQKTILWDLPLLKYYDYEYLTKNTNAIVRIRDFNPNQLMIYGWANFNHLIILKHFKGKVKIAFRGDSNLLNKQSFFKGIAKKIILHWIYKHIDQALYVGTNNKAYFLKYGLNVHQLIFSPHAVDNERFSHKTNTHFRVKLGIKEDEILILYAGKLIPIKNLELLIQAFLNLNIPKTHLLFTGSGVLESVLRAKALHPRYSAAGKRVHFMAFQNQSNMPSVYQCCDLFCLPSHNESWGLSINEAMAAGKAILASDKTGAATDLINATNGAIFKSNDLNDLEQKLRELLISRPDLKNKGASSRLIIEDWNFDTQIKNMLNAFQQNLKADV